MWDMTVNYYYRVSPDPCHDSLKLNIYLNVITTNNCQVLLTINNHMEVTGFLVVSRTCVVASVLAGYICYGQNVSPHYIVMILFERNAISSPCYHGTSTFFSMPRSQSNCRVVFSKIYNSGFIRCI